MIRFAPLQFFTVGPLNISIHGLLMVAGIATAFFFARRAANKKGIDEKMFDDLVLWMLLGGLLGARISYVLLNPQLYTNIIDIVKVWQGGITSFGGIIGGTLTVWLYLKKKKQSWLAYADLLAPYVLLGWGIGRIGDFLSWGEIGTESMLPWAVNVFGTARHPVQLYETILLIGGFFLVQWLIQRKKTAITGYAFFLASSFFFVQRFLIEFVRDYPGDVSVIYYQYFAQGLSIFLLLVIAFWWRKKKK